MTTKSIILAMAALAALAGCSNPEPPAAPNTTEAAEVDTPETEEAPQSTSGISEFDALEQSALDGDYQAQRNLAYTLSTGVPNNPVLACAWRIVILKSGDPQVDQSDVGNKQLDCDRKLDVDGIAAAEAQAKQISELIIIRDNRLLNVDTGEAAVEASPHEG